MTDGVALAEVIRLQRMAFLDGIAWMSEHTYLDRDPEVGYHVAEPSELDIRRAADEYGVVRTCSPGECHCEMRGMGCPQRQL